MKIIERIDSMASLGNAIRNLPPDDLSNILIKAKNKNGWFTNDNCNFSLNEIVNWLTENTLQKWVEQYEFPDNPNPKTIGIVMAGNIPLVGFHDLLSVLISGHKAKIKLSSQDDELLPFLIDLLLKNDNRWQDSIIMSDRLNVVDAVIATGSDNSARYFESYFNSIPRIIRKNRTSVGIILGEEQVGEYALLASDIFTYFGMGCRNVSKLYVPYGFDFGILLNSFQSYQNLIDHNKYANNYNYQKTIRIISSKPFQDLGFILMEESDDLVSPIAVLYYQYYSDLTELQQLLERQKDKIQCVVSAKGWFNKSLAFGTAQHPNLNDYADNIDTLKFLQKL